MRTRFPLSLLLALIAVTWAGSPARASIEDFETWDLGAQEGDDEYGLDSYFLAFSPEWETEWLFSPEGARSSMGSTVNEVWEMRNEIRLMREFDPRFRLRYAYLQNEGLTITDEQHSIGLEFQHRGFWFGPFARPNVNKQLLDAGLTVRRSFSMGLDLQASVSFEDWNSDHTNGRSSIKDREFVDFIDPAREWRLSATQRWSRERWLALDATWLPVFRRGMQPSPSTGDPDFLRYTEGNHFSLRGLVDAWRDLSLEFRAERKRSRVADFPETDDPAVDIRRRAWLFRTRLTHPVAAGVSARVGLQYREGNERDVSGGPEPFRLAFQDYVATAGIRRPLLPWLTAEFGYGHQSTDIAQQGPKDEQRFTWGTRTENRLYLIAEFEAAGFRARLTETIELDNEGYDAVSDHDKGSIQLQAVF